MGQTRKRRNQNSQVTAQPKTLEILQYAKSFAKKCKDNFNEGTLNWLIGFNCFSLLFYFVHIGLNIYSLYHFYTKGDMWYFGCTLAFWLIPAGSATLTSFLFYNPGWPKTQCDGTFHPRDHLPEKESDFSWIMKWVLGLIFCPIPRYWDTIKYALKAKQAKKTNDEAQNMYFLAMIWEDAELLQLRQFHSFMESAPQLLLGLYIAIKEKSLLGYSSIFKIVTIGSLSWALLSYDNKICLMNGKRDDADQPSRSNVIRIDFTNESEKNDVINCIKNINWKESALSFFAHFSWIVARLIVLSLFASVRGWFIWPACLSHIFLIVIWHNGENYNFMDSLRLSFLHVFAYLYPLEKESDQKKHPRFSPLIYLTACICENLFLMLLWSQSFNEDKGINLKISSIQFYPWKDWTFFLPWVGHILIFILSYILFRLLDKHRKPFSPITPVSSVPI